MHRMALDQCLPQFFLKQNRRGTHHRTIIVFFLLCGSILLITRGRPAVAGGGLRHLLLRGDDPIGIGDILLKVRRKELKRTFSAGWPTILIAIVCDEHRHYRQRRHRLPQPVLLPAVFPAHRGDHHLDVPAHPHLPGLLAGAE